MTGGGGGGGVGGGVNSCFPLLGGRLTGETVDLLAAMGSALIGSVKARDSWVFAGRAGTQRRSQFEKVSERKMKRRGGKRKIINGKQMFPLVTAHLSESR